MESFTPSTNPVLNSVALSALLALMPLLAVAAVWALRSAGTPEQQQTLKTKMMERRARRGVPSQAPQCAPSCSSCPSQQTK